MVEIGHHLIGGGIVPDAAQTSYPAIDLTKFAGFHTQTGGEYLADMGTVYEAQNLRQLLHSQVGIQQKADGSADAHFPQQVEEGQPCGLGDVSADSGFTEEELP